MTSRKYYDMELQKLNGALLEMGEMIRMAISGAVAALLEHDHDRARSIIAYDEEIDKQNRQIEQQCYSLLLSQQPVAGDLRMVSAALKMTTDMERIGDHAADISEIELMLEKLPALNCEMIRQMATETSVMLIKSLEAFAQRDRVKAEWVIDRDDVVDDLFDAVKGELIGAIRQNADNGEAATDLLMAAKYFERIGDHASDIAEIIPHLVTVRKEGDPAVSQAIAMGRKAYQMIQDAMAALTAEDELAARKVIAADDAVDFDFNAIKHTLAQEIAADPAKVDAALDLLMVIKYLERIGDHAVNVAEWVQFVRTGRYKDESMF